MASPEAVKFLKKTPLFAQFTQSELEAVFRTAKERDFDAGSTIVREGDVGAVAFYLILEGQVEVRKGQKSLAKLGAGEYFGEAALVSDKDTPRNADVVALTKTRCLMLTRWELRGLIAAQPDIAVKIMAELTRRLEETNKALRE